MSSHKDIYTRWLNDPFKIDIPGGETLKDFKARVMEIFYQIVSDNEGVSIGIVTHAGPIRIILNQIANKDAVWEPLPEPGSIHVIEFENIKEEPKRQSLSTASKKRKASED